MNNSNVTSWTLISLMCNKKKQNQISIRWIFPFLGRFFKITDTFFSVSHPVNLSVSDCHTSVQTDTDSNDDSVAKSTRFLYVCFFLLLQENTNIEEAARCLIGHILNNEEVTERDAGSLVLSGYTNPTKDHLNCLSCAK